jgi:hypothetical protein
MDIFAVSVSWLIMPVNMRLDSGMLAAILQDEII